MRRLILLLSILPLAIVIAGVPPVRPESWAQPIAGTSLGNLFRVTNDIYRSEQPHKEDLKDLKALGIKTILSLRNYHEEPKAIQESAINTIQVEMKAGSVTQAQLIAVLRILRTAPKPVLIHCWHGSDRTGFIVAGYRMVFMDWTAEQAIEELRKGGFGYHGSTYPNIIHALKSLDIVAMKKAVLDQ